MKQTTKRTLTLAGAAALIIGVGGVAFAQGYGPGYGPGWGGHHGMMGGPGGGYGPGAGRGMMMGPGYGPGPGPGAGRGMMGGYQGTYAPQQLDELKSTLGITPDQEAVWNRYADAVEARAELMQTHRQQMFTNGPVGPDQRLAFHQQGMDQLQKVTTARRDLFNELSPQQRATADNYTGWPCAVR